MYSIANVKGNSPPPLVQIECKSKLFNICNIYNLLQLKFDKFYTTGPIFLKAPPPPTGSPNTALHYYSVFLG